MHIRKAVIFGAAGATGRPIARELLRRGIQVRVVSRNRGRLDRAFQGTGAEIAEADLKYGEAARRAADSCDLIFHCLGVPLNRFRDHIPLARSTVSAMRSTGARGLLVGSFWSYEPILGNPVSETHPRRSRTLLGRIRREQEDILQEAGAAVTILPDFYGPHAEAGLLNPALRAIDAGKTANWIGDLDAIREFIHVPDCAFPIVELALRESSYGERWHVAGPGPVTPRELLRMAGIRSGREPGARTATPFVLSLLGLINSDVRALKELYPLYLNPPILDTRKLRGLIGDYPVTSYESGIEQTINWIRKPR